MKFKHSFFPLLLTICLLSTQAAPAQTLTSPRTSLKTFEQTLTDLENVTSVTRMESNDFKEKYLITVRQMVNPKSIRDGFFDQRVFVMHVGFDRPTVLVTEGYGADYASSPRYREELSRLLDANLIVVEHRYFSKSTPQPRVWKYLNADLAMNDVHIVRELFRDIYPGKWIDTGISKGGQTALMYRSYYPDDVDITVSYVGPLCRGAEDGRHEPFIAQKVGSAADRERVLNFQKELLIRKDSLMKPFTKFCNDADMKFTLPLSDIYDYAVLEYSFAFWQWGTPVDKIPSPSAPDSLQFAHFIAVASPDYLMRETPTQAFFIQAAQELGYYGYDTAPFRFKVERTRFVPDGPTKLKMAAKKRERQKARGKEVVFDSTAVAGKWVTQKMPAMDLKSAKGYMKDLFLPDFYKPRFNTALYKKMSDFVKNSDAKMVFIYGEWDPWSAAAVPNPNKPNVLYYVQPGGSHSTRIGTLPEAMRQELMQQLNAWLAE